MKTYAKDHPLFYQKRNHSAQMGLVSMVVLLFVTFSAFELQGADKYYSSPVDSIHHVVDKQPVFKGKPSDVKKFIGQNMVYPDNAWVNAVEGIVEVSFIITGDGKLMNAKIEKSIDADLDMEALRLIDLMVNWKPGLKNGAAVNTFMILPIVFTLAPDEKEFIGMLKKYGLNENPPLYVIDDKIINSRIELPSYNLKSVRVVKGQKALERFGDKGRNGVVIVETKHGTAPLYE